LIFAIVGYNETAAELLQVTAHVKTLQSHLSDCVPSWSLATCRFDWRQYSKGQPRRQKDQKMLKIMCGAISQAAEGAEAAAALTWQKRRRHFPFEFAT
jgi:hypothetical protein